MSQDRLITLAIHTYEKAIAVKSLLEGEGIKVTLQNVNLEQPAVSAGIRVRIAETDLASALRIIENCEVFTGTSSCEHHESLTVLVPIDFSEYSRNAVTAAFDTASRHNAVIKIIHAYVSPFLSDNLELSDNLTFEIKESETRNLIEAEARNRLDKFASDLKALIKQGLLPPVKFTTDLQEGIPEEVIVEHVKKTSPWLIVMGTRGAGKKEKELVGSVTAEVLDSCRTMALTVPENFSLLSLSKITDIVIFGNLDQEDILALDALHRIIAETDTNGIRRSITLACVPGKKHTRDSISSAQSNLIDYCKCHYPEYTFDIRVLTLDDIFNDYTRITSDKPVELIVVANKKRNIFSRLFNPALPHRLLFHFDIPMLVIPV